MSGLRARERRKDKASSMYNAMLFGRNTKPHVLRKRSLWGPRCASKHSVRVERGIVSREDLQRRLSLGRDRIEYRLACKKIHWDGRVDKHAIHIPAGDEVRIIGAPTRWVNDDPEWRIRYFYNGVFDNTVLK